MTHHPFDLEDRLIDYAILVLELAEKLPKSALTSHIAVQLARSGTSPALNYGEAQSAESARDFIHKIKLCLKELRESRVCLKILQRKPLIAREMAEPAIDECNQLIAILMASIRTKQRRMTQIE